MPTLTSKQIKSIMARAKMQRARVHIGLNGLQPNTLAAFINAFDGTCVRPTPSDVVRVKVHPTFTGDLQALIDQMCEASGAVFVKQDAQFLVFWKPKA